MGEMTTHRNYDCPRRAVLNQLDSNPTHDRCLWLGTRSRGHDRRHCPDLGLCGRQFQKLWLGDATEFPGRCHCSQARPVDRRPLTPTRVFVIGRLIAPPRVGCGGRRRGRHPCAFFPQGIVLGYVIVSLPLTVDRRVVEFVGCPRGGGRGWGVLAASKSGSPRVRSIVDTGGIIHADFEGCR